MTLRFLSIFAVCGMLGCERGGVDSGASATSVAQTQAGDDAAARIEGLRSRFQIHWATPLAPFRRADVQAGSYPAIGPGAVAHFGPPIAARVAAELHADAKKGLLRTTTVELPTTADGSVRIRDDSSQVDVTFAMVGAKRVDLATTRDGIALYRGAGPSGSDIVHRAHARGIEDLVVFEQQPAIEALVYDIDVSHVAGLRLLENIVEFIDVDGTPVLRVLSPYVASESGQSISAKLTIEGCAYDRNPAGPWRRPVTPPGASICGLRVAWQGVDYPAIVDPSWVETSMPAIACTGLTATRLPSGQVLLAGGFNGQHSGTWLAGAELFDGVSTFSPTGSMAQARASHTATLLASGKVLITGGDDISVTASAEVFDGSSFTTVGSMSTPRVGHTATLLDSGQVLIIGGTDFVHGATGSADLFDGTSAFTAANPMATARSNHAAARLDSGKVLVAGGTDSDGSTVASAEIFDGVSFAPAGSLQVARSSATATLLPSGRVLVAGGSNGNTLDSAELFDGATFRLTGPMLLPRTQHTATLMPSGVVLLAGGQTESLESELFDGVDMFVDSGPMNEGRQSAAAALLASGNVLVADGNAGSLGFGSAEIFSLSPTGEACATPTECKSGLCGDGQCGCGSDSDCADESDYCSAAHTCKPRATLGQACESALACPSGASCVDGICCSAKCGGPCEACNLPGRAGTCSPAARGPQPNGKAMCGSAECRGTCDGVSGSSCVFPVGETCKRTCVGDEQADSICNSAGECIEGERRKCTGFLTCDNGMTCRDQCANDFDCAAGHVCSGGGCVVPSHCVNETTSHDGQRCAPYACDGAKGTCYDACSGDAQCGAGASCKSATCVDASNKPHDTDSGGCACRSGEIGSDSAPGALVFCAIALLLRWTRRFSWRERRAPAARVRRLR